jgi:hypothetical protein
VEHPTCPDQPLPAPTTLMCNYAGKQQFVPTMMLQEIPTP